MIAGSDSLSQPLLAELREHDPVVQRYRAFFALLDWDQIPERDPARPWPGPLPHPRIAYVKALLVKLCEGKPFVTQLRSFLLEHPLLVVELGFHPVLDATSPEGFDVAKTVPSDRWLRTQQQTVSDTALTNLLKATGEDLRAEIPDLGTTVAPDVKHIYAWVQENNPKAYTVERFNPTRQPAGDPDCRLGVKRRSNQENPDGTKTGPAEYLWGYGTGVMATTTKRYGDVVLAEMTQTFNANDVTYFATLYRKASDALGRAPTNVTADAAFDAWQVYETCVATGGTAAIPLNLRGHAPPQRDAQGIPQCSQNLPMVPQTTFVHDDGYRAQRFGCPLLHLHPTGQTCSHPQFAKGIGCTRVVNLEPGGKMRVELDRASPAFHALYRQRTSSERINSQATALGIERPKVRNLPSVCHLTTLTYIIINARALQRARAINAQEAAIA